MVVDGVIAHTTPLVGRVAELEQVARLLENKVCRIVTLKGPGGIGKTRLAVHIADALSQRFPDGCHFVFCASLDSTDSAGSIVLAIAEAVGLSVFGTNDPADQLTAYLREKCLLLVVDNFDHLIEYAPLLGRITHNAPAIRLLVTSRERLGVGGECALTIRGLPVTSGEIGHPAEPGDAAHLFQLAVQRVVSDFGLEAANIPTVNRICRLVEGMPLALELAASWARAMSLAEIADEIARNLDILAERRRDLPDRHRSMRVAFDYSWQRLSPEEQQAFKQLSVFRGTFNREAAARIAGAALPVLAALVDKSLVRYDSRQGFDLHELLRQYGEEKLRENPADHAALEEAHSVYYATWIAGIEAAMHRGGDIEIGEVVEPYFRNIQAGWRWAAGHGAAALIAAYALPLSLFCGMRGLWRLGRDEFVATVNRLRPLPASPERDRALARVLVHGGWFLQQLLDHHQALQDLEEGLAIVRRLEDTPAQDTAVALCFLGVATRLTGDMASARRHMEDALAVGEGLGETGAFSQAFALVYLAETASMQQDFASARAYSQRCLAVSRAAGVDAGKSIAPAHLILSQLGLGDASAACRSLRQDVDWEGKLAHQIAPLTLILIAASMTFIQIGEPVYAAEVLSAAMNLPLGDREFYAQFGPARAALNELESRLTPDALRAAMERGKTPILTRSEGEVLYTLRPEFVAQLLAMLDQAERPDSVALTPREREVLNYIARGLSNEEIAAELVISFGTAKRHVHNIFEKLGVHNRTQAAARARELGISSPLIAPPPVQKN